jgi:hypothetical protein
MRRTAFLVAAAVATAVVLSSCQAQPPVAPQPSASAPSASDEPDALTARKAAQAWADKTFGTFDPFTVSGSGAAEIPFPSDATSGFYTITWSPGHDATENSYAQVYGEDGAFQELGTADYIGDSASVAYGLDPDIGPADWIGVEDGAGDWTVTVSPISALPALPDAGGYDAYLYSGAEQPVMFSSATAGRVGVRQFHGGPPAGILHQDAVGTLLAGPSVVTVQLESVSPWTRSTP